MLLKYIGLILLQNKALKEQTMINQNSFTQEFYSILAVNTQSLVQDFNWKFRLRCGYMYNTTIIFRCGRVTENGPKCCPCCGKGDPSFIH